MKNIIENIQYKKNKSEKNIGFYIAAVLAAVVYGEFQTYTFWALFIIGYSGFGLIGCFAERRAATELEHLAHSLAERVEKNEITLNQAEEQLKASPYVRK